MRGWLLLFLVLIPGYLLAQNDVPRTFGNVNGVWWRQQNLNEKVAFMEGFNVGRAIMGTPGVTVGTLPVCPTTIKWEAVAGSAYGAVIKQMDSFYATAANLPMPVDFGMVYSIMKLTGATQRQLDTYRTAMLNGLAALTK